MEKNTSFLGRKKISMLRYTQIIYLKCTMTRDLNIFVIESIISRDTIFCSHDMLTEISNRFMVQVSPENCTPYVNMTVCWLHVPLVVSLDSSFRKKRARVKAALVFYSQYSFQITTSYYLC